MCLVVVCFSLIDYFTEFKVTSRWIVELLGFAYGIIAADHSDRNRECLNKNWIGKCIALMIIAGVMGISYLKFKPILFWGDYLLKIVLGIVILAFMYETASMLKVGNKINRFLGNISYEVYVLHYGVFLLLIALTGNNLNSGAFVVSAVVITIALAVVLNRVCKPIFGLFR